MAPEPCCREAANLVVIEDSATVTVQKCSVCGRRHFRARMEPLDLRAAPSPLGG